MWWSEGYAGRSYPPPGKPVYELCYDSVLRHAQSAG
jgi:hypothetical protein